MSKGQVKVLIEVEEEMEFVIVREEFSDDEEVKPEIGTVKPITAQSPEESTAGSSQADYEVKLMLCLH